MTLVAVAEPKAGTGFGSSATGSVRSVICTGAAPLLVTSQTTVVSPAAGSHSALAANTTDGAAGLEPRSSSVPPSSSAASVGVGAVVVGAAVVVAASVGARRRGRRRRRRRGFGGFRPGRRCGSAVPAGPAVGSGGAGWVATAVSGCENDDIATTAPTTARNRRLRRRRCATSGVWRVLSIRTTRNHRDLRILSTPGARRRSPDCRAPSVAAARRATAVETDSRGSSRIGNTQAVITKHRIRTFAQGAGSAGAPRIVRR